MWVRLIIAFALGFATPVLATEVSNHYINNTGPIQLYKSDSVACATLSTVYTPVGEMRLIRDDCNGERFTVYSVDKNGNVIFGDIDSMKQRDENHRVEVVENEGYTQTNEYNGDRLIRSETHYKKPIAMPLKLMPEESEGTVFITEESWGEVE